PEAPKLAELSTDEASHRTAVASRRHADPWPSQPADEAPLLVRIPPRAVEVEKTRREATSFDGFFSHSLEISRPFTGGGARLHHEHQPKTRCFGV
ncbi:hypothetical protein TorRG33x02_035660, partial [Trema orientale]